MKIKVVVTIEAPNGATHYTGELTEDPTFWKTKRIAGHTQWLYYHHGRKEWLIQGDHAPYLIKAIEMDCL